jgi:hypothetical protein
MLIFVSFFSDPLVLVVCAVCSNLDGYFSVLLFSTSNGSEVT